MKIGENKVANIRKFAPDADGNSGNEEGRIVIGRHLFFTLFL
jgi:hypothetical protein